MGRSMAMAMAMGKSNSTDWQLGCNLIIPKLSHDSELRMFTLRVLGAFVLRVSLWILIEKKKLETDHKRYHILMSWTVIWVLSTVIDATCTSGYTKVTKMVLHVGLNGITFLYWCYFWNTQYSDATPNKKGILNSEVIIWLVATLLAIAQFVLAYQLPPKGIC